MTQGDGSYRHPQVGGGAEPGGSEDSASRTVRRADTGACAGLLHASRQRPPLHHSPPSQLERARQSVARASDAKVKAAKALETARPVPPSEESRTTTALRKWEDQRKEVSAAGGIPDRRLRRMPATAAPSPAQLADELSALSFRQEKARHRASTLRSMGSAREKVWRDSRCTAMQHCRTLVPPAFLPPLAPDLRGIAGLADSALRPGSHGDQVPGPGEKGRGGGAMAQSSRRSRRLACGCDGSQLPHPHRERAGRCDVSDPLQRPSALPHASPTPSLVQHGSATHSWLPTRMMMRA